MRIFFSETVLKFLWNRLEILECGVKFVGQVSFIGDYGENIFFVAVLKFLGIVWIMGQLFTQKSLVFLKIKPLLFIKTLYDSL